MRAADMGGAELQRPVRFRGVGAKSGGRLADLEATEAGALPQPGQPSRDISTAMRMGSWKFSSQVPGAPAPACALKDDRQCESTPRWPLLHFGSESEVARANVGPGLHVLREIALAHAGSVQVPSIEAVTEFQLSLPGATPSLEAAGSHPATRDACRKRMALRRAFF